MNHVRKLDKIKINKEERILVFFFCSSPIPPTPPEPCPVVLGVEP
jgi:hypothetical protein